MSNNQYPPLPDASLLRVLKSEERPDPPYLVYGFTADQMRAYVDADRSQRKPLTEQRIEQIAVSHEDFGFGRADKHGVSTHGFCPEGLIAFVRSIEAEQGIKDPEDFSLGKACDLSGDGTCEACQ